MIKVPSSDGHEVMWVNPLAIRRIYKSSASAHTTIDLGNGDDVITPIPPDDVALKVAQVLKQMTYELNYKKGK